jgi:hypothetical protein
MFSIFLYSRFLNFFDVLCLTFHAVFDTLAGEPDKIIESTEHNSWLFGIFFEDCQFKKFYAGSISIPRVRYISFLNVKGLKVQQYPRV